MAKPHRNERVFMEPHEFNRYKILNVIVVREWETKKVQAVDAPNRADLKTCLVLGNVRFEDEQSRMR